MKFSGWKEEQMVSLNMGFLSVSKILKGQGVILPRCGKWLGSITLSRVTKGLFGV